MKKRGFTFLLIMVLFLLSFPLAARADVLLEPNNSFYERHRSECTYLSRSFYANGKDGYVALKSEPNSKTETAVIENGDTIRIMFTYSHNGEMWGVTEISSQDTPYREWPTGWIPMNQLLLMYDYISFEEDHKDEFYKYTGDYSELKAAKDLVLWAWPGSGNILWSGELPDTENFRVSNTYRDAEGREWGVVDYWYGIRNVWACLSDPENIDIPAFNPAPEPELWPQADMLPSPNKGISTPLLISILVAILVIGTIVLVRIFWKPNREKQ